MSDQGKQYAAYIEAELKAENELRSSINTRAGSAITASTGFVTLVLGVFAVFLGKDYTLSGTAKVFVVGAVMALLAAAFCALIAGLPWRYKYTLTSTLLDFVNDDWGDDEIDARNKTTYCNVIVLDSLRVGSATKVRFLIAAGVFQILAVAFLGLAVAAVSGFSINASPPPAGGCSVNAWRVACS